MKNLENYGVQTLSTKQITETNGGNPLGWLLGSVLYDLITDWDGISAAFDEGVNDVRG